MYLPQKSYCPSKPTDKTDTTDVRKGTVDVKMAPFFECKCMIITSPEKGVLLL